MSKFEVGKELWWVPSIYNSGTPSFVTVTKVGRKWITLNNHFRIDCETMFADGGYNSTPPGRCYFSKKEYDDLLALRKAWEKLLDGVQKCFRKAPWYLDAPEGLTVANIEEAERLLGLVAKKVPDEK